MHAFVLVFREHRSTRFPMLSARLLSECDTFVICHAVLILCLGSFLLQDMFLRLYVLALQGQRLKYSVKITHALNLYCDAGTGYLI